MTENSSRSDTEKQLYKLKDKEKQILKNPDDYNFSSIQNKVF